MRSRRCDWNEHLGQLAQCGKTIECKAWATNLFHRETHLQDGLLVREQARRSSRHAARALVTVVEVEEDLADIAAMAGMASGDDFWGDAVGHFTT